MSGDYGTTRKYRAHLDELRDRGLNRATVEAVVVSRRLQALAALGWSTSAIAAAADMDEREVQRWRLGRRGRERVTVTTVDRLDVVYRDLTARPTTCRFHAKVTAMADARGWVPPCAWPLDAVDRPHATPQPDAAAEFARLVDAGVSRWAANQLAARRAAALLLDAGAA